MKIIQATTFNKGHAYVFDNIEPMQYERIGSNMIVGTNGLLYRCYVHKRYGVGPKAFGGAEFSFTMKDGEEFTTDGWWWDYGQSEIAKKLNVKFGHITYSTIEHLKKCYVFTGAEVDVEFMELLIEDYNKENNKIVVEYVENGKQQTWEMAFYPEYLTNGIDWVFNCWAELA